MKEQSVAEVTAISRERDAVRESCRRDGTGDGNLSAFDGDGQLSAKPHCKIPVWEREGGEKKKFIYSYILHLCASKKRLESKPAPVTTSTCRATPVCVPADTRVLGWCVYAFCCE